MNAGTTSTRYRQGYLEDRRRNTGNGRRVWKQHAEVVVLGTAPARHQGQLASHAQPRYPLRQPSSLCSSHAVRSVDEKDRFPLQPVGSSRRLFRAFRKFLKGPVRYGDKSSAMHLSVQDGATIDGVMEALQGMKTEADGPLS